MVIRIAASTAVLSIAAVSLAHAQGVASDKLIDSITVTGGTRARRARRAEADRLEDCRGSARAEPRQSRGRAQVRAEPDDPQALHRRPQRADRRTQLLDAAGAARPGVHGRLPAVQLPRPLRRAALEHDRAGGDRARRRPVWSVLGDLSRQLDRHDGRGSHAAAGRAASSSVRTTAFGENFDEYGVERRLLRLSGRRRSSATASTTARGSRSPRIIRTPTSHPMQYFTVSQAARPGSFPRCRARATPVTGVVFDRDPHGRRRAVFGANAGAIDHTCRISGSCAAATRSTTGSKRKASSRAWRNDTREREPHLHARLRPGSRVWSGRVIADGIAFNVPASALAPSTRDEQHCNGARRCARRATTGWNGSLVYLRVRDPRGLHAAGEQSRSDRRERVVRARTPSVTARAGRPSKCRACTRRSTAIGPAARTRSRSAITRTNIDSKIRSTRHGRLAQPRRRAGRRMCSARRACRRCMCRTRGRWQSAGSLTLGVRYEDWSAFDGGPVARGIEPERLSRSRTEREWSPKASLAFGPTTNGACA